MVDYFEKRKGGGKLTRTETVTVRLDPKLRYLAELAARKQRRTLSSYIEWAIEDSLGRTFLDQDGERTLADQASTLWDVDDADRFVKLAFRFPDLLTHGEQVRWKLIRENGFLWRGRYAGNDNKWTWSVEEDSLVFDRLRQHWTAFCDVAESGTGQDSLPTWPKNQPSVYGARSAPAKPPAKVAPKTGFDSMDDDIPF